ncbi:cupin domain-containing protein [Streptomyces pseudovenezuelae]|uniref:Mannose-6-phosphate isomerase-like protein (Cupin superfamily) n=1 Tax=Streptomyces pseudovenezuelae TaxID=67350 RepID=A0ABT6LS81_9ACTN|nr:cupin domain-containing protein [Streptomyces pseudovenezuelae]MDH6218219.1 mannose-6-phosphate isomerase-like protein (cupin superfamily) [Streptomyces pseudovenezuelae]
MPVMPLLPDQPTLELRGELMVADTSSASVVHAMHGGADTARWKCLARRMGLAGTWEAVEWASLPPGAVCGEHHHTRTEELYFVISGEGEILLNDIPHRIRPGHLVVNGLGTRHQFRNLGDQDLNWLVIEVFGPDTAHALVGATTTSGETS